jgi:hypothetical protein
MSLHCFFIPARGPEPAQTEPNNCMGSRRVLAVQRECLHGGAHSGWAFCVEVLAGPHALQDQRLRTVAKCFRALGANRKGPGVLVGSNNCRTRLVRHRGGGRRCFHVA